MEKIQMVDLKAQYQHIKAEVDAAISEVISNTAFINGPAVSEFQKDLENYLHVKHVIPCANGTDALQIAMMGLGFKPGDEVITASFTYVATAEVIALLGLKPVLVDVDPLTFNIDPIAVEKAITDKTVAIVPVHLFGQCADMEAIMDIATRYNIHVIEDKYKFDVNPDVVMGATKWLTLHKYRNAENNTATCFSALRNKGYKIVATSPHARGYTMYDLPLDQKTALVFGTELKGLSQYAMDNADDYVAIPLYGFTESFNISVTAALFIQYFTEKIRRQGINWGLTDDEKTEILLQWAKKSVAKSYLLEKYFIDNVL